MSEPLVGGDVSGHGDGALAHRAQAGAGRPTLRVVVGVVMGALVTLAPTLADQRQPDADAALARAMDLSAAFERAAAKVSPAVVNVTATIGGEEEPQSLTRRPQRQQQPQQLEDPFEDFRRRMMDPFGQQRGRRPVSQSMGSGIVVSADGYILTNNHVIDNATKVEITLSDNSKYAAKVIGADPATDVAVLKIEGSEFTFATLGDSESARVGEWVLAIGNPFGLNQTVTAGIISAKNRVQNGPGQLQDVQFQDFIQTDAAINRGNSGGALVNLRGEVIGINSAIIGPANVGIGFAIPASMAKGVMDSLIASGKVDRGYLGVNMQELTPEIAKSYDFQGQGVLVTEVQAGGPADKAGLKAGDIVTRFDGKGVTSMNALRNSVASTAPGKKVDIEVVREGRKVNSVATLGSRAEELAGNAGDSFRSPAKGGLGITVHTLNSEFADQIGEAKKVKGVVITEIEPRSAAAGWLTVGDVITQVMNQPVTNADEFRDALAGAELRRGIRLVVRSQGQQRIVVLRIG